MLKRASNREEATRAAARTWQPLSHRLPTPVCERASVRVRVPHKHSLELLTFTLHAHKPLNSTDAHQFMCISRTYTHMHAWMHARTYARAHTISHKCKQRAFTFAATPWCRGTQLRQNTCLFPAPSEPLRHRQVSTVQPQVRP